MDFQPKTPPPGVAYLLAHGTVSPSSANSGSPSAFAIQFPRPEAGVSSVAQAGGALDRLSSPPHAGYSRGGRE